MFRHEVIEKGHKLKGETDSEVITHMIEEEVKTFGSVENVLLYSTLKYMDGAILVLTKDGTIYGIRTNHNPLYVGLGDNFVVCGSTVNALTHVGLELNAIIRLRVKQVVRIRNGVAEFLNEGEDEYVHLANIWSDVSDYFRDFF
jgi:glucosamine 6-phosphate synthetase-like amidotransferase/phosphosugar isomerase protein